MAARHGGEAGVAARAAKLAANEWVASLTAAVHCQRAGADAGAVGREETAAGGEGDGSTDQLVADDSAGLGGGAAGGEAGGRAPDVWALLLETGELHTLRALAAATAGRVAAATTVIPNPSGLECAAITTARSSRLAPARAVRWGRSECRAGAGCARSGRLPPADVAPAAGRAPRAGGRQHRRCAPLPRCLSATPHAVQAVGTEERCSHAEVVCDAPVRLAAAGWPGAFGVAWLDYCGTLNSRAGRARRWVPA